MDAVLGMLLAVVFEGVGLLIEGVLFTTARFWMPVLVVLIVAVGLVFLL